MTFSLPLSRRLIEAAIFLAMTSGFIFPAAGQSTQTLIPRGAVWKYLDNGSDQGTAWRAPGFNDGSWASGPAELGYGDGGEATIVSYGPNSSSKYTTTYFRHAFNVADPAQIDSLEFGVRRDDGAVVYLNGTEVGRLNMPGGTITSSTWASTAIGGAEETTYFTVTANPSLLAAGTNVVAVEIHQANGTSSDISFDLELTGYPPDGAKLVAAGDTWNYLDNGSDQGTAWKNTGFDDSGWASGPAQLGYGDGDEARVVSFGPEPTNKYITTYFRRNFSVADLSVVEGLELRLLRDDGAVVYINGQEVHRSNMPGGTISSTTLASSAVGSADESRFFTAPVSPGVLVQGTNLIAVEIHQANTTSSDISFDLELVLAEPSVPKLARGPYLQQSGTNRMTVRWRTDQPTESVVRYGLTEGTLDQTVTVAGSRTEHVVTVTGLAADTVYYYDVGHGSETLAGGPSYFFKTHPAAGTPAPGRIWLLGDSGTADANAAAVRDAFVGFNGGQSPDLVLMLGDNAYNTGTDTEYQAAVFNMYPSVLRNTPLWPTLGNHDSASADSPTQSGVYYNIFSLPTAAESGGLSSGTEAYYSFDWGNVHFVCLDSDDTSRAATGAMATWLKNDLASTTQEWIVGFWHHPPYSKGSHDSDNDSDSGGRMRDMREIFVPILEDYGVDVMFTGHSHSYERSMLIDGHYGKSSTFNVSTMAIDTGDGDPNGEGAYVKEPLAHRGAVHIVAGASGKISGGSLNHPVMVSNLNVLGSVVLDVAGDVMDLKYLDNNGAVRDTLRIVHDDGTNEPPVITANQMTLSEGDTVTLTSNELAATDIDDAADSLLFTVDNVLFGRFQRASAAGAAINSFSQGEITAGDIQFVHEMGSGSAPSYDVSVTDGLATVGPSPAAITFNSGNTPPTLTQNQLDIVEGQTVVLTGANLAATDAESLDADLVFTVSGVAFGQFLVNGSPAASFLQGQVTAGEVAFAHDGSENEPSYAVAVSDGEFTDGPHGAIVTYSTVNETPVLIANSLTVSEGEIVMLTIADLDATDEETVADLLTFFVSEVTGGHFELGGSLVTSFRREDITEGLVEFVHFGTEEVPSYKVSVSDGNSSTFPEPAAVTFIPVNDPPGIVTSQLAIDEGAVVTLTRSELLASDAESGPAGLTFTVSAASRLTFELNGQPATAFTQADVDAGGVAAIHDGSEFAPAFNVSVSDGQLSSGTVSAAIAFTPVNDAPVADDQSVTTAEDTSLPVTLSGSDADGDPITFTVTAPPASGTLSGTAPDLTYTPDADFHGADSLTFTVSDGTATSAPAVVAIDVTPINDAPVADDQSVTVDEDTATAITLTGSDVDGDALTFAVTSQPSSGTLSGTAPDLSYTPDANYQGGDSFTFTVSDGNGGTSAAATVSITVTDLNDAPVADDQSVTTAEDTAVTVTLTASDTEGDALTYAVVTPPSNGTLSGTAPNLTYTPDADFAGADSFTFVADDGTASSMPATVSITVNPVNDAPTAADSAASTDEDTAVAVTLQADDVDGDALTYTIGTQPASGTLSGTAPDLTYTPDENFHGTDTFTFSVSDGTETAGPATVTVTVASVNDAPESDAQALTTAEDTSLPVTLSGSDAEGDPITFTVTAPPVNGTLSGTAPDLTYTPDADFHGSDSFEFSASDGSASSLPATVAITVTPVNDPPLAASQSVTTDEDTPLAITLTGSDADGDALTFAVTTPPSNGALTGTAPDLTYTPDAEFAGSDSFAFTASDGTDTSAPATVTITVSGVNDEPVITANQFSLSEGGSLTLSSANLAATDAETPSGDLQFSITGLSHASFEVGGAASVTFAQSDITSGSVVVIHDGSESEPAFSIAVSDGELTAGPVAAQISYQNVYDPEIQRGPYIQMAGSTSVTIRWTTDEATGSEVRFGTSPDNLASVVSSSASTTDHEAALTGLAPDAIYYYSVGDGTSVLESGSQLAFRSAPEPGTAAPVRLWLAGGTGHSAAAAASVRDGFIAFNGSARADGVILLGDSAQAGGSEAAMDGGIFVPLEEVLKGSPLWTVFGDHEAAGSNAGDGTGPYFEAITAPAAGELGGAASASEAYYSFDTANIHIVVLDSAAWDMSPTSPMVTWLDADLASTAQEWIIAVVHHPPYSDGTSNSDDPAEAGGRLTAVREILVPILESYGADLMLAGHSQGYERSFLLDGHYDVSSTLDPSMIVDGGDGDPAGTGAYSKPPAPNEGAVYTVAGSSGGGVSSTFSHPVMVRGSDTPGSVVLDINGNVLDAFFVGADGSALDVFRIQHSAVSNVEVIVDDSDPGFATSGKWQTESVLPGFHGSGYRHDDNRKKGNNTASWTPNIPEAGEYSVSMWWPANAGNASAIPIDVFHQNGVDRLVVSQTSSGSQWVLLGNYHFAAGTSASSGSVTIYARDPGTGQYTNGFVIADAVKFSLLGSAPPDTTPPAAPAGLTAAAGDSQVSLDWNDSAESDFASYNVYRSLTSGSAYEIIASGLTASAFTDMTAVNDVAFFYVVTALDKALNESAPSNEVSATPQAAPANTVHVSAIQMSLSQQGPWYTAQAAVMVRNSSGQAAAGVTVSGNWTYNGSLRGSVSAVTDAQGVAVLSSSRERAGSGDTFTATVTDLTGSGVTYDPGSNVVTSGSITVP